MCPHHRLHSYKSDGPLDAQPYCERPRLQVLPVAILAQALLNFFGRLHAMSAALIGQLLSACAGAYSAASSAVWWAASLPPTCRESLTHAALTCSGATPRYFTPGFGPLALAWGWLLLGVLLGLLFRRAAAALVALAGGHAPQCAPCSWEALLRELAARTEDPNRHEVLQYLLQGGEAAVRDLSQATNRTPTALMAHLLTDSTVADAAALRPANVPARRRSGRH